MEDNNESPKKKKVAATPAELRKKYEDIIAYGADHPSEIPKKLHELRKLILLEGMPPETDEEKKVNPDDKISLRGKVWKILLQVGDIDYKNYIKLVSKGPVNNKELSETILKEKRLYAQRALRLTPDLFRRIPPEKLVRIPNALMHALPPNANITYAQGMTQWIIPFLYVMPEVDAFYCLHKFLTVCAPRYYKKSPQIEGTIDATMLFEQILAIVDEDLSKHLLENKMTANIYASTPIRSLNGHQPPLEELLKLWDYYIAFGVHLNVLFAISQVVIRREELLATKKQLGNLLLPQRWPKLNAQSIINLSLQLLQRVPKDLESSLIMHPYADVKEIYKHKKKKLPFGAQSSSDLKAKEIKEKKPDLSTKPEIMNGHSHVNENGTLETPAVDDTAKPNTQTSGEFSDAKLSLLWMGTNVNPIENNTNVTDNESTPKKKNKIRIQMLE